MLYRLVGRAHFEVHICLSSYMLAVYTCELEKHKTHRNLAAVVPTVVIRFHLHMCLINRIMMQSWYDHIKFVFSMYFSISRKGRLALIGSSGGVRGEEEAGRKVTNDPEAQIGRAAMQLCFMHVCIVNSGQRKNGKFQQTAPCYFRNHEATSASCPLRDGRPEPLKLAG